MLRECIIVFYFQSPEQICRIAAAAVVSRQHFQRHGLPKPPGPADTDKFFFCVDKPIGAGNQPCLVHINFRTGWFPEPLVSRIQIKSHMSASFLMQCLAMFCGVSQYFVMLAATKVLCLFDNRSMKKICLICKIFLPGLQLHRWKISGCITAIVKLFIDFMSSLWYTFCINNPPKL